MDRTLKKAIYFKGQEKKDPNFLELKENLKNNGIEILEIDIDEIIKKIQEDKKRESRIKDKIKKISIVGYLKKINTKKDVIAFTSRKTMLKACHDAEIPVVGYYSENYYDENLMGAEIVFSGFKGLTSEDIEDVYKRYYKLPITICQTKRCIIKEMSLDRFDELYDLYQQPHFTDYMEPLFEKKEEYEYQKAYIENVYPFYGYGYWLVIDKKTDKVIGRAGVELKERQGETSVELGYGIHPKYQRQGIAKEVCKSILEYVKKEFGLDEINCYIENGNLPSIALAESLGFEHVKDVIEGKTLMQKYVIKM